MPNTKFDAKSFNAEAFKYKVGTVPNLKMNEIKKSAALAANPDILLMDEPFGAVDEITRKMLQSEIIRIHEQLGVTIVFITHDIKEALKLGTRVMVMNKGLVEQLDTPDHIRNTPATPFVKELIEG